MSRWSLQGFQLGRDRRHGGAVGFDFLQEISDDRRMIGGDVKCFAGIDVEVEQEWRVVGVGFGLTVAFLSEEMELPAAVADGVEICAAIIEKGALRSGVGFEPGGAHVGAVNDAIVWERSASE